MNKYEKMLEREAPPKAVIEALRADLEDVLDTSVELCGPFGLRCEWVLTANGHGRTVCVDYGSAEKVGLYYDTGERTNRFQPNSIGEINGFNNVQAPIDRVEEFAEQFINEEEI